MSDQSKLPPRPSIDETIEKIKTYLDWVGPSGKKMGHIVLDRAEALVILNHCGRETAPDARELTDHELRARWIVAGGDFHGPHTETGHMPESKLLPFLRKLIRG